MEWRATGPLSTVVPTQVGTRRVVDATCFLIASPPHRFQIRNEHRRGARWSARQNDRQITGSFRSKQWLAGGSRIVGQMAPFVVFR
jgi:hypothetical protein